MVTKIKRPKKGPIAELPPAPALKRPGGIGGPAELPPFLTASQANTLVKEVLNMRQRIQSLENALLAASLGRVSPGDPNELPAEFPEGGEGGGIGVGPRPDPELPIDFSKAARDIATLTSRVASLEANVLKSINALNQSIAQLKTK